MQRRKMIDMQELEKIGFVKDETSHNKSYIYQTEGSFEIHYTETPTNFVFFGLCHVRHMRDEETGFEYTPKTCVILRGVTTVSHVKTLIELFEGAKNE
jgi:hypothetical protein